MHSLLFQQLSSLFHVHSHSGVISGAVGMPHQTTTYTLSVGRFGLQLSLGGDMTAVDTLGDTGLFDGRQV